MSRKIAVLLTLFAAGRAMTIPFIGRAGDGGLGDPPAAWLMPLVADAAIGVSALAVAALLWWRPSPVAWIIAVVWSAIGAFDAIAAFIVETSAPWPDFFMLELVGRPMFFAAALMHVAIIALLARRDALADCGIEADGAGGLRTA
ncbi:MAG: hypothetical protein AAFN30_12850 [Actinomycetota bacterium]